VFWQIFNPEIEFNDGVEIETEHDYWHRRGALLSINGALIPVMTVVGLAWGGRSLMHAAYGASLCEQEVVQFSVIHAWVQLTFALWIAFLTVEFLLVKGIFGLGLVFCPRKLVQCKKCCGRYSKASAKANKLYWQKDQSLRRQLLEGDSKL
jgi:hypothetical protein